MRYVSLNLSFSDSQVPSRVIMGAGNARIQAYGQSHPRASSLIPAFVVVTLRLLEHQNRSDLQFFAVTRGARYDRNLQPTYEKQTDRRFLS